MTSCAAANDTISFTLLNVRSLRKHRTDLKFDQGMTCCDVLALSETRLKPSETNEFIEKYLDAFQITRQDNDNDFISLAFCTKITVQCFRHLFCEEINGLLVTIQKAQILLSVLLIYRPINVHKIQFLMNLENIISCHDHKIDMIFGDFNINCHNESNSEQLRRIMDNFGHIQIVKNATFVSAGSLLDHVYVRSDLLNALSSKICCNLKSVCYSDHDAVQICLEK